MTYSPDVPRLPPLGVLLPDGVEYLVPVHVARVLVVAAVGDLPRVVGHQQRAVEEVPEGVVQDRVGGEGAVAAVVAEDEQGPEQGALEGRIIFICTK